MRTVDITEEAKLAWEAHAPGGKFQAKSYEQLPDGMWRVELANETYDKIAATMKPGETFSQTIIEGFKKLDKMRAWWAETQAAENEDYPNIPLKLIKLNEICADHVVLQTGRDKGQDLRWQWEKGELVFYDARDREFDRIKLPGSLDVKGLERDLKKDGMLLLYEMATDMPAAFPLQAVLKPNVRNQVFKYGGKNAIWRKVGLNLIVEQEGRNVGTYPLADKISMEKAVQLGLEHLRDQGKTLTVKLVADLIVDIMRDRGLNLTWTVSDGRVMTFRDEKLAKVFSVNLDDFSTVLPPAEVGVPVKVDGEGPLIIRSNDARISNQIWADSFNAMTKRRTGRTKDLWKVLAHDVLTCQIFEFGDIENTRFKKEGKRAAQLIEQGHLSTPFQTVAYWYTVDFNDSPTPEVRRIMTLITKAIVEGREHFLIAEFHKADPEQHAQWDPERKWKYVYYLDGAVVLRPDATHQKWQGDVLETGVRPLDNLQLTHDSLASSLGDGMSVLSLLIATKGIPQRKEVPSPKLQKKRTESKKPLLPTVTYIDTKFYQRAAHNTARGGTHASPVPHLRRGHVRSQPFGPKNDPKYRDVWIKDQLINCRSMDEVAKRDHYEVKT